MKRILLASIITGILCSATMSAVAAVIYVDNQLADDCIGTYSIANRDSSGSDGDAFNTIIEAANTAVAGDIVYIREGVYHAYNGLLDCDVLWPKNSGTKGQPITFRNYPNEEVVLGRHPTATGSYPNDSWASIARGVITMKDVDYIVIEGLKVDQVAGWAFIRNCNYITVKDCQFSDARWGAKGCFRMIEVNHSKLINNSFIKSTFDNVYLIASNYNVVENNYFDDGEHSVLAIRSGNYNVIRNNVFRNPYIRASTGMAEKLVEVYDIKVDTRDPENPAYIHPPQYDNTRHNLFENNWFGYHPYWPDHGAQPSAIQFSGQKTIIRHNIFSNPPIPNPDPNYEARLAGGIGLNMRWGGSWEGWNGTRIVGEGHEAGFVHGNRIYNNTFNGYDNAQVTVPSDNAMDNFPEFAPMENVADFQNYPFAYTWKFEDNVFKNNIFYEGNFVAHISWAHYQYVQGTPTQIMMGGNVINNIPYFEKNNFFATGKYNDASIENVTDWLIYNHAFYPYQPSNTPDFYNQNHPNKFALNIQQDPGFIDPDTEDFHLNSGSQMIDSGTFLTKTTGAGSGSSIDVGDAGYFYDGYGIEGETGDVIQLEGQTETARIVSIDYINNTITLNRSLSWEDGQGVSLCYAGSGPDIGAYEYGLTVPDPKPDPDPNPEPEPEAELNVTALRVGNNIIKSGGNQKASIRCDMKEPGQLTVRIYDARGREIITVCNEHKEAGSHSFLWAGVNSGGSQVGSGIYIVHMKAGGYSKTKKIAVVK